MERERREHGNRRGSGVWCAAGLAFAAPAMADLSWSVRLPPPGSGAVAVIGSATADTGANGLAPGGAHEHLTGGTTDLEAGFFDGLSTYDLGMGQRLGALDSGEMFGWATGESHFFFTIDSEGQGTMSLGWETFANAASGAAMTYACSADAFLSGSVEIEVTGAESAAPVFALVAAQAVGWTETVPDTGGEDLRGCGSMIHARKDGDAESSLLLHLEIPPSNPVDSVSSEQIMMLVLPPVGVDGQGERFVEIALSAAAQASIVPPGEGPVFEDVGAAGVLGTVTLTLSWINPLCPGDPNGDGAVTVPDIFFFLVAFFEGSAAADFDGSGAAGTPDIFAFLSAWFVGCD